MVIIGIIFADAASEAVIVAINKTAFVIFLARNASRPTPFASMLILECLRGRQFERHFNNLFFEGGNSFVLGEEALLKSINYGFALD